MSDEALTKVLGGMKVRRYAGRSDLYRWLRANHRQMAKRLVQDQSSWGVIASQISAVGIVNRDGKPPSADSVRRVWATVCRDVAAEEAARAANPKRRNPSRISPDWRPQIVSPAGLRLQQSSPGAGSTAAPASKGASERILYPVPVPMDAPFDFATMDANGNAVPEGHVFYRGRIRTRQGAEQSEKMWRRMRLEDRDR